MSEINKIILLCFKDYPDLFKYRREKMNRLERYCNGFRNGDTMYRLGLMNSSTACGLSVSEAFFVNCSVDDCRRNGVQRFIMTKKDTEKFQEELQVNLDRIDSMMKLYEYCASGELRQYTNEVAMQKLNEKFELKRDERMMEFCKEILEKYENKTLDKVTK